MRASQPKPPSPSGAAKAAPARRVLEWIQNVRNFDGAATSGLLSLTALCLSTLFLSSGCTTKAVAIEECREIEKLRCEASVPCGIIDSDEVEECKRVYHDQCLHGIAGPKEPTADQQKQCLNLIESAGETAEMTLSDDTKLAEYEAACAIVSEPWKEMQCEFLNEKEENTGGSKSE